MATSDLTHPKLPLQHLLGSFWENTWTALAADLMQADPVTTARWLSAMGATGGLVDQVARGDLAPSELRVATQYLKVDLVVAVSGTVVAVIEAKTLDGLQTGQLGRYSTAVAARRRSLPAPEVWVLLTLAALPATWAEKELAGDVGSDGTARWVDATFENLLDAFRSSAVPWVSRVATDWRALIDHVLSAAEYHPVAGDRWVRDALGAQSIKAVTMIRSRVASQWLLDQVGERLAEPSTGLRVAVRHFSRQRLGPELRIHGSNGALIAHVLDYATDILQPSQPMLQVGVAPLMSDAEAVIPQDFLSAVHAGLASWIADGSLTLWPRDAEGLRAKRQGEKAGEQEREQDGEQEGEQEGERQGQQQVGPGDGRALTLDGKPVRVVADASAKSDSLKHGNEPVVRYLFGPRGRDNTTTLGQLADALTAVARAMAEYAATSVDYAATSVDGSDGSVDGSDGSVDATV